MFAYRFDKNTKKFVEKKQCQIDKIESKNKGYDIFLLPANSTFIEPLEEKEGFSVIWKKDSWVYEKNKEPSEEEKKEALINALKFYLSDTDWVVVKIAEKRLTADEKGVDEDLKKYADTLKQREAARARINELEKEEEK